MLCNLLAGLGAGGYRIACQSGGVVVMLADLVLLTVLAVTVVWVLRQPRWLLPGVLGAAGALLLAAAIARPEIVPDHLPTGGLVVAVIDDSESVRRDDLAYSQAVEALAASISTAAESLTSEELQQWSGTTVYFGQAAAFGAALVPLDRLADVIRVSRTAPPEAASNAARGLQLALQLIRNHGGAGVIWLLGDGHWDMKGLEPSLLNARSMGVAVHVLPAGSDRPGAGIIAADLAEQQVVGRPAVTRLTLVGAGQLSWYRNGDSQPAGNTLTVPDLTGAQPARLETTFHERGIQFVDTVFSDAATGANQLDRRFSLVRGPARVLAFNSPFLTGIPTEAYVVQDAQPEQPPAPDGFDVIVVGGIDPGRFPEGYIERLADAAATGTGVLITNGPQRGATSEPQRLADWEATAMGPMLPVTTDPRIVVDEPPRRDVLIMIDASDSMNRDRLATAKSVVSSILAEIRPVDTITMIPFDSSIRTVFGPVPGTAANMSAARSFVAGIRAGGGTAPMSALEAAARMTGNNCAFFFISDGFFTAPTTSPQCFTTSVGVAGRAFPGDLAAWGEEITLEAGEQASGLRWAFFEPEEREDYYRTETFTPLAIGDGDMFDAGLPVHGLATAYPRVDAEMVSITRVPPPDPVLAFRTDTADTHTVAVFTGDIPAAWGQNPNAQAALLAILDRLTGWNNPDRFAVALTQAGERFEVVVTVLNTDDGASIPTAVDGQVALTGGQVYPLGFQEHSTPGQFSAEFQPRLTSEPQRATLVVGEPGAAAQRIPLLLPALTATSERQAAENWAYGLRTDVLQSIARTSGGYYLRDAAPVLNSSSLNLATVPLYAPLVAIATLLLAGALYTGGARP